MNLTDKFAGWWGKNVHRVEVIDRVRVETTRKPDGEYNLSPFEPLSGGVNVSRIRGDFILTEINDSCIPILDGADLRYARSGVIESTTTDYWREITYIRGKKSDDRTMLQHTINYRGGRQDTLDIVYYTGGKKLNEPNKK